MENIVLIESESKEKKPFTGEIKKKDLMVEINITEAPMFSFTRGKKNFLVKDLLESTETSIEAKKVMSGIYDNNDNAKIDYKCWTDSKGLAREMIISSSRNFPDAYAMDVFLGLVAILIRDNNPLCPDENGYFRFKSNNIKFTLYELCEVMEIKIGGNTYDKIRESLRQLKSAEYYSLGAGTIYNKKKEDHEVRGENAISIIESYSVSSRSVDKSTGKMKFFNGEVKFGSLIMANLELGFARVLRDHQYFKLKSGITRGLYLYIEANRNAKDTYMKRSFDVLKNKIPIDFEYPSRLKIKLKKALDNLIEQGIISDYFYADEILINGIKEPSIYIIFKGTRKQLIDSLEKKNKPETKNEKKKKELETDYELELPNDIKRELIDIGINSQKINEIMKKYSKWKIAEYILWIKDGIKQGKVKDPAGLFVFGITDEKVKVGKTHPQIIEFISQIKAEVEGKEEISKAKIDEAYSIYIETELKMFEEEEEFAYIAIIGSTLDDIDTVYKKRLKAQKQLYNMAKTEVEKEKLLKVVEKWESFSSKREESELFKEFFIKEVKRYRGLKGYEDFKRDYIEKNK